MAMRQYIGARYVPKFYEGSNGSEWDPNVQYEPLTVVTYLSNSYTSKKFVPAAIGSPILNPDYWVSTGNYNAQVQQIEQDIIDLQNDVGTIQGDIVTINNTFGTLSKSWLDNKKIYVFGDSLTQARVDGICENLAALVPTATIVNESIPGADYALIATTIASTDITDADVVLILGGTNNWQGDSQLANFYTDVNTAVQNVLTQKKTVELVLITPPFSYSSLFGATIEPYYKNNVFAGVSDYGNVIKLVANQNHIPVIDLFNYSNIGVNNFQQMMENSGSGGATIYVHPIGNANKHIANLIVNQVFDNKYTPFKTRVVPNWDPSGVAVTTGGDLIFDPNTGSWTLNAIVTTSASFSTPTGMLLQMHMPAGAYIMFTGHFDGCRIPVYKYGTNNVVFGIINFNGTYYDGAINIEGNAEASTTYVFAS